MACERCRCDHREPMGIKLRLDIVDDSTSRQILTNLRNAGVERLYFPPAPRRSSVPGYLEANYVFSPYFPMINFPVQSRG